MYNPLYMAVLRCFEGNKSSVDLDDWNDLNVLFRHWNDTWESGIMKNLIYTFFSFRYINPVDDVDSETPVTFRSFRVSQIPMSHVPTFFDVYMGQQTGVGTVGTSW